MTVDSEMQHDQTPDFHAKAEANKAHNDATMGKHKDDEHLSGKKEL